MGTEEHSHKSNFIGPPIVLPSMSRSFLSCLIPPNFQNLCYIDPTNLSHQKFSPKMQPI